MERRKLARERRIAERTPFVAAVVENVGEERELALAQNIGAMGMALRRTQASKALPAGPVKLSFELPDGGDLVQVHGWVVFERAEGAFRSAGVRFWDVSPADYARILRFVRNQ